MEDAVHIVIKSTLSRVDGTSRNNYTFPWRSGRALIGSIVGTGHHATVSRLCDASTGAPLPLCIRSINTKISPRATRNELFGLRLQLRYGTSCFGILCVLQYGSYVHDRDIAVRSSTGNGPMGDALCVFDHSCPPSPPVNIAKYLYCVMPMCVGGDLFQLITTPDALSRISAHRVRLLVRWLLKTLVSLKENRIIHGDIKPENICFLRRGKENMPAIDSASLVDFGLSKRLSLSNKPHGVYYGAGTPGYMAPEVVWNTENPTTRKECSFPVDVFSAGITLFVFCLDWMTSKHRVGAYFPGQELYNTYNTSLFASNCTDKRDELRKAILGKIATYHTYFPRNQDVISVVRVLVDVIAPMMRPIVLYRPSACTQLHVLNKIPLRFSRGF